MLYASGVADIVGPFPNKFGKAKWGVPVAGTGQINGTYFAPDQYISVPDPQCGISSSWAGNLCTIDAIALRNPDGSPGQIVLQNPLPGTRGTLGQFTMENPGSWRFDANIMKSFSLGEGRSLQVRVDTTNVLNHPSPGNPSLTINNSTFGEITTKSGSRQFQGQLRLTF